jgi:hypothetical protein
VAGAGDPTHNGRVATHERLHNWIPLAIVIASCLAAVMGWRASVLEEDATHSDELSRQELVQQQQLLVQDNQSVDADISIFGQFVQDSLLAQSLRRDAARGKSPNELLQTQAQGQLEAAGELGSAIENENYAFDPSNPMNNGALNLDGSYAVGNPYGASSALTYAENGDYDLHGLVPAALHAQATSQRGRALAYTGLAALFIAALVFFTMAAVTSAAPTIVFALSGAVVLLAGLSLFAVTQFS